MDRRQRLLIGAIGGAVAVVVAPVLGVAWSILSVTRSFDRTAHVDPSEKAKVLAEGISEAMNGGAVLGIGLGALALVATVICIVAYVRAGRAGRAKEPRGE